MLALLLFTLVITIFFCLIIFFITAYLKKTSWGPLVICIISLTFLLFSLSLVCRSNTTTQITYSKKEVRQLGTLQTVNLTTKMKPSKTRQVNTPYMRGSVSNFNSLSPLSFYQKQKKLNNSKSTQIKNDFNIITYQLKNSKWLANKANCIYVILVQVLTDFHQLRLELFYIWIKFKK